MKRSILKGLVKKIFLSHVSSEEPLAKVLKKWIETAFEGRVKVFVSGAIDDLPAGEPWLDSLNQALSEAKGLIVLFSPYSITRPWVIFESGGAWVRNIPIISICHSGQTKADLPPPLSFFQALDLGAPGFFHDLVQSLAKKLTLKVPPHLDDTPIMEDIRAAKRKIKQRARTRAAGKAMRRPRKKRVLREAVQPS